MGVFCDRLKFGSTAALDCRTGQNKGSYPKKELLLLLVLLFEQSQKVFKPHDHLLRKVQVIKPMCGYIFYHIIET